MKIESPWLIGGAVVAAYFLFIRKDDAGMTGWESLTATPEKDKSAPAGTPAARVSEMKAVGFPAPSTPIIAEVIADPDGAIRTNYDASTMRAVGM